MNTENIITLSDGKRLCYAEYGDPEGVPIFMFHGNPGSRLVWGLLNDSPFLPGIRIIAPDRPGFGRTEFKRNALERWPYDMEDLADHLKLEKFNLFAPSGGGPYALACAWKIPHRLEKVGVYGSVGPNVPEAREGVMHSIRMMWKLANPFYFLVKLQNRLIAWYGRRNTQKFISWLTSFKLSEYDKVLMNSDMVRGIFGKSFPVAFRQKGIGSSYDATIPGKWFIPFEEIERRILVWHAEEDTIVGNMARYIAGRLPNSELISLPNAGHLWLFENMQVILNRLMDR